MEDEDDDEMDEPRMQLEVESLQYQLEYARELSSVTIPALVGWVQEGAKTDPILNAELMKENPWVDKGKCVIL